MTNSSVSFTEQWKLHPKIFPNFFYSSFTILFDFPLPFIEEPVKLYNCMIDSFMEIIVTVLF